MHLLLTLLCVTASVMAGARGEALADALRRRSHGGQYAREFAAYEPVQLVPVRLLQLLEPAASQSLASYAPPRAPRPARPARRPEPARAVSTQEIHIPHIHAHTHHPGYNRPLLYVRHPAPAPAPAPASASAQYAPLYSEPLDDAAHEHYELVDAGAEPSEEADVVLYAAPTAGGGYSYSRRPPPRRAPPRQPPRARRPQPVIVKVRKYRIVRHDDD